jgi:hypothetical protein
MKSQAMFRICKRLKDNRINLGIFKALEFFAREGDWQTQDYANEVKELHAWEIDSVYELRLRANLPKAFVRIGNSFELANEKEYYKFFDFIVFDNPQNTYGDYCEHFEAISLVIKLLKDRGIVIFNINLAPFNYEKFPIWQKRRTDYYGCDASKLSSFFLLDFYEKKFKQQGFKVDFKFEEKRNNEYLSYLVFSLSKAI